LDADRLIHRTTQSSPDKSRNRCGDAGNGAHTAGDFLNV
jgi:hypothetical protein